MCWAIALVWLNSNGVILLSLVQILFSLLANPPIRESELAIRPDPTPSLVPRARIEWFVSELSSKYFQNIPFWESLDKYVSLINPLIFPTSLRKSPLPLTLDFCGLLKSIRRIFPFSPYINGWVNLCRIFPLGISFSLIFWPWGLGTELRMLIGFTRVSVPRGTTRYFVNFIKVFSKIPKFCDTLWDQNVYLVLVTEWFVRAGFIWTYPKYEKERRVLHLNSGHAYRCWTDYRMRLKQ